MGKGAKKHRRRPEASIDLGGGADLDTGPLTEPTPIGSASSWTDAIAITGAKKPKKTCCRSTPRCKGCPVVLMRAARLSEAGVTGKDLKKALKKARAA